MAVFKLQTTKLMHARRHIRHDLDFMFVQFRNSDVSSLNANGQLNLV